MQPVNWGEVSGILGEHAGNTCVIPTAGPPKGLCHTSLESLSLWSYMHPLNAQNTAGNATLPYVSMWSKELRGKAPHILELSFRCTHWMSWSGGECSFVFSRLIYAFCSFTQSLQANAAVLPQCRPRSLPFTPFPIYYVHSVLLIHTFHHIFHNLYKICHKVHISDGSPHTPMVMIPQTTEHHCQCKVFLDSKM